VVVERRIFKETSLSITKFVVPGDAAVTATNMLAHESLFRLGFAGNMIALATYIAVTALFYELFKPVNRTISFLRTPVNTALPHHSPCGSPDSIWASQVGRCWSCRSQDDRRGFTERGSSGGSKVPAGGYPSDGKPNGVRCPASKCARS
jgi:hypothetical protein